MRRTASRLAIVLMLVGIGWAVGRAQTPQAPAPPDFELIVDAPVGETTVTCKRGCELVWVERGLNPNAARMPTFTFKCSGPSATRCSSAAIGGWITDQAAR